MNVSCRVSVRPSGAGMGNIHFRIYMLALNISCQHLGDECKLEGFCAPFGRRVGEYTFLNIMLVLNISCQQWGDECKLENIYIDRTSARRTSARQHIYMYW